METVQTILGVVILIVSGLGAVVVVWGVLEAITAFVGLKFSSARKDAVSESETIRQRLGAHLLLGLEIFSGAPSGRSRRLHRITRPPGTAHSRLRGPSCQARVSAFHPRREPGDAKARDCRGHHQFYREPELGESRHPCLHCGRTDGPQLFFENGGKTGHEIVLTKAGL